MNNIEIVKKDSELAILPIYLRTEVSTVEPITSQQEIELITGINAQLLSLGGTALSQLFSKKTFL